MGAYIFNLYNGLELLPDVVAFDINLPKQFVSSRLLPQNPSEGANQINSSTPSKCSFSILLKMGFRNSSKVSQLAFEYIGIRLFKGLTLNLSKTGTSWTIGGRGVSVNLRDGKATGNVGIPSTGLSYREKLTDSTSASETETPIDNQSSSGMGTVIVIVVLIALGYFIGKST